MTTSTLWGGNAARGVTCIACGETLDREYDEHGDRWTRGKELRVVL